MSKMQTRIQLYLPALNLMISTYLRFHILDNIKFALEPMLLLQLLPDCFRIAKFAFHIPGNIIFSTSSLLLGYKGNQTPQCLIHRLRIREILSDIRFNHHGSFFKFEKLYSSCSIRFVNFYCMSFTIVFIIFSPNPASHF